MKGELKKNMKTNEPTLKQIVEALKERNAEIRNNTSYKLFAKREGLQTIPTD